MGDGSGAGAGRGVDEHLSPLEHHVSDTTLRDRPRRVDRCRCVRPAPRRRPRRCSTAPSASTCPKWPSTDQVYKAPYDGEGNRRQTPSDRGILARKWSSASTATASRSAGRSTAPIATTCACCYPKIRRLLTDAGLGDHIIQPRRQPGDDQPKLLTLGLRWAVEAANSWLSNYGQLRRNTDRKNSHRHAALRLATTILRSPSSMVTVSTGPVARSADLSPSPAMTEATSPNVSASTVPTARTAMSPSDVAVPLCGASATCPRRG